MDEQLAELCGIISGDGHLSRYISKKRTDYKLIISGHKNDDAEYFEIVRNIFKNSTGESLKYNYTYYLELRCYSKAAVELFETLGIIVGKKSEMIRVPDWIKEDLNLSCAFLRGLADTDFSFIFRKRKLKTDYPRITVEISSKPMIKDICLILTKLDIKYCGPYQRTRFRFGVNSITYQVDINGHKNFDLWMKYVGFRNPKHLKKIKMSSSALYKRGRSPPSRT